MNKMLVALLASASLLACGAKKEPTTPVTRDRSSIEHKDDAMGGAGYGGKRADGAAKDPANPCAPK